MTLSSLNIILLLTSLTLLLAQLFVREKQTAHILFAIFCGSVAMMLTKKLSGDYVGAYQYLIGMGACATCNGYWLLSRSIFREKDAILPQHLIFAAVIALLIMANQGYLFVNADSLTYASQTSVFRHTISELTILLSSCILVLSFWEGCRGFSQASKQDKAQRILFLTTFGFAVLISKISQGVLADNANNQAVVTGVITLLVLINTQILLYWRFKASKSVSKETDVKQLTHNSAVADGKLELELAKPCAEQALAAQVKRLLVEQSLFLQTSLKVADIARELDVPEYKISKALRHNLSAKNFNQYVNELRIKHAQSLLADPDKQKWPVLVVGLESGFASVGPFTRAFKAITGYTPNQYRQHCLNNLSFT